jgi:hypothetical protein
VIETRARRAAGILRTGAGAREGRIAPSKPPETVIPEIPAVRRAASALLVGGGPLTLPAIIPWKRGKASQFQFVGPVEADVQWFVTALRSIRNT